MLGPYSVAAHYNAKGGHTPNGRCSRLSWAPIPITALLALISLFWYLGYRFGCVIHATGFTQRELTFAWIFFAVELLALSPNALPYLVRSAALRPPLRPRLTVDDEEAPPVDVMITCCGEDVDEILATVRAACNLDYPAERFRVFVLDDGADDDLFVAIKALKSEQASVHYHARQKGPVKDYKAGNLNAGIAYSASTSPWSSSLIAGLDADMIPERGWLRQVVPHLMADPATGLACPPQHFYNLPRPDTLSQDLALWHRVNEVFADALQMANCTGFGWVMKRKALQDIGGFPVDTLAEDTKSSAMMLGLGWKTVLVQEPLQFGRVPESIQGHIKQRIRWYVGHVQNALQLRFLIFGRYAESLTLVQKIAGFGDQLAALLVLLPVVVYLGVPLALLSGHPFIIWSTTEQLKWLIRAVSVQQICSELHRWSLKAIIDFAHLQTSIQVEGWLLPYYFVSTLRCFILPSWLGGRKAGFSASGSVQADLRERDAHHRAPTWRRVLAVVYYHMGWVHVVFIAACWIGAFRVIGRVCQPIWGLWQPAQHLSSMEIALALLTRIGWPPAIWLVYTVSALKPLTYACFPPTDQGIEQQLEIRDGAAYPTEYYKYRRSRKNGWYEFSKSLGAFVYCLGLLVLTGYM